MGEGAQPPRPECLCVARQQGPGVAGAEAGRGPRRPPGRRQSCPPGPSAQRPGNAPCSQGAPCALRTPAVLSSGLGVVTAPGPGSLPVRPVTRWPSSEGGRSSRPCLRQVPAFLCGQAGRSPSPSRGWPRCPGPGPATPSGRAGFGVCGSVPDCELVPVSSLIRSHDTVPGPPTVFCYCYS